METSGLRQRVTEPLQTQATKASSINPSSDGKKIQLQSVIPAAVLAKVAFFSVLMFTLPLAIYFATIDNLFRGQSLYSAICAVVTANLVLVAFIVVAFTEDSADASPSSAATTTPVASSPAPAPSTRKTDHYAKLSLENKISETDLNMDYVNGALKETGQNLDPTKDVPVAVERKTKKAE